MINQSSIKYISSLLSRPENIADGDHSSIALFRQTFPYFVPARYIQAAESNKKSAFSPRMISEIQPYLGNWILFCNYLEAGSRSNKEGIAGNEERPQQKAPGPLPTVVNKAADNKAAGNGYGNGKQGENDNKKQGQKVPGFMQQANAGQQKQAPVPPVVPEVKAEPVRVTPPAPPVVVEVKKEEIKAEPAKPIVASSFAKATADEGMKVTPPTPPVVAEVKKEEIKAEPAKPVVAEVKVTPPAPPVVAAVKKEEIKAAPAKVTPPAPPVVVEAKKEEIKAEPAKVTPPAPPVVVEAKKEEIKAEPAKVTPPAPPVVAAIKKEEIKTEPVKVTPPVPPVVAEVKKEETKAEPAKVTPPVPPVVAEVKREEIKAEPAKPVVAEVKVIPPVQPVVAEIKKEEIKAEPVKPVVAEVKVPPVVPPVAAEVKAEKETAKEIPKESTRGKEEFITPLVPTKVIFKKQIEKTEEILAAKKKEEPVVLRVAEEMTIENVEVAAKNEEKEKLILPIYTDDYFLQQGMKVSIEIPEEIEELKEVAEEDDEDKSLMVVMSFSEWLLHFKNTAEKQKEEKKDQKALKTMWQKEKLAAAMEEENEEIPENVFEMAVNSITKEDGLASESLADIYIKQGKYDKAIEMYRKLSLRNPKKNAYFARRIEEVLKEKQS